MKEPGYIRFACDRAEKAHGDGKKPVEFMTPEDKEAKEWQEVQYVDSNGVTRKLLLCPECAEKYRSIAKSHAEELMAFENESIW